MLGLVTEIWYEFIKQLKAVKTDLDCAFMKTAKKFVCRKIIDIELNKYYWKQLLLYFL